LTAYETFYNFWNSRSISKAGSSSSEPSL